MYGAGLTDELRAEFFVDRVNCCEDSPETMGILRIVRVVRRIAVETNWIWNFDGHGPDFLSDSKAREKVHELFVEAGDTAGNESHLFRFAAARRDGEHVIDEIKFDLEDSERVGNRRSVEAARADVQRDFPPMIGERAQREADLTDDLRPHVEGVARGAPFGERERRPRFDCRQ